MGPGGARADRGVVASGRSHRFQRRRRGDRRRRRRETPMSRKIVRLTLDHLDALPDPCRSCLFWELDPVRRARVEDPRGEKDAWLSQVLREWGSCGRVALVDDVPVGYLVYAPEAFVPGAAG